MSEVNGASADNTAGNTEVVEAGKVGGIQANLGEDAIFTQEIKDGATKEELAELRKKMHSAFTQKAQKAASFEKKSAALDKLLGNPKFVKWAQDEMKREAGLNPDEENPPTETISDDDTDLTPQEKRLKEIEAKQDAQEKRQYLIDARLELNTLEKDPNFADIKEYYNKMMPLVAKGYSYEDAYKIAKYPEAKAKADEAEKARIAKDLADKKNQNLSSKGSSSVPGSGANSEAGKKMSAREAIVAAMAKKET